MSRMVSFIALIAVIVVIGVLFYKVMASFLLPLFLAAILVVVFRPLHVWITERCRGRERIAAGLTTAAILLIVLLPMAWVFSLAIIEGVSLATDYDSAKLKDQLDNFREKFDLDMPLAEHFHIIDDEFNILIQNPDSPAQEVPRLSNGEIQRSLVRIKRQVGEIEKRIEEAASTDELPAVEELLPLKNSLDQLLADNSMVSIEVSQLDFLLKHSRLSYRQFRQKALGGPVFAWLKGLANPSAKEFKAIYRRVLEKMQSWLLTITGATTAIVGNLMLGVCIMVLALYYFLVDGPSMIKTIMQLSPLEDRYEHQLLEEFDSLSRAVVLATLLSALAQGLLAGIGYFICGLDSIFLLTMLTMIMSLVPFIGAAAVWVPTCIWLFFINNQTWAAVFLAIYGFVIISMADNLIKPFVLKGQSNMHPLIALLSVLGGVQALGPIGILVGPMIVAFLQTLLNMLHRDMAKLEKHQASAFSR